MKYIIIVLVISSILAITAYVLDFTNNKTDKIFLIIVGSLLILTGLFFSIKGEIFKDAESQKQAESLSKTKENTEDLKETSDVIIADIKENLNNLIVINDSVSQLNTALSAVERDIAKQLETFDKTLTQTKVFEQKVSEQFALEKKRFALERPEVEVAASLEKKEGQGNKYGVLFEFRNLGKRVASNFNTDAIVGITKDKINLTEHLLMKGSLETFDITPMQAGGITIYVRSSKQIDATNIEDDLRLVVLLKYTYKDEFLNQTFEKENYFFWYGFNKNDLTLVSANNKEFTDRLNRYMENNQLKL